MIGIPIYNKQGQTVHKTAEICRQKALGDSSVYKEIHVYIHSFAHID